MFARSTARALKAAIAAGAAALLLTSLAAAPALAQQQSTVTAQACQQGRIRNSSGAAIPQSACEKLVGQPIRLAFTGLDAWVFAVGGIACIGGGLLMRRRLPARS